MVDGTLNLHNSNMVSPYAMVLSFLCSVSSDHGHSASASTFTEGNTLEPCDDDFAKDMLLADTSLGTVR